MYSSVVSKIIVRFLPRHEQTFVGGGTSPEKLPRLLSQSGLDRILFDTRSGSARPGYARGARLPAGRVVIRGACPAGVPHPN